MTYEEELRCKKIASRFLKELGLYGQWKQYIDSDKPLLSRDVNRKNWFKNLTTIDHIFGRVDFTSFLGAKCHYCLPEIISKLFRQYISTFHCDYKIINEYGISKRLNIDEETHNINI